MADPHTPLPRLIDVLLRWGTPVLAGVLVVRLVVIFLSGYYDWDLDHELYFGQRLLAGELIWTREFHDKLPFVQILFALPAYFESIQVWRLMSLASVTLGAVAIITLVPRLLRSVPDVSVRRVCTFAALLYLVLSTILPGELSHINPMAGAFALTASLLMLWSGQVRGMSSGWWIGVLIAGGFLAAAAISIRPYLLVPLVLITGFSAFAGMPRPALARVVHFALWAAAVAIWGITLNLLPYVVTGQLAAFLAGMGTLAQDINPLPFLSTFRYSLELQHPTAIAVWAGYVVAVVVFVAGYRRGSNAAPFVITMLAATVGLLVFVAQRYWWGHYINFFTGYFCLTILFMLVWLIEGRVRFSAAGTIALCTGLGGLVVLTALWTAVSGVLFVTQPHMFAYRPQPVVEAFRTYRALPENADVAFLAPTQMALHWKFDEPRHGFPHAANTGQIYGDWWQSVTPNDVFETPRSAAEYCALLYAQAPELVVDVASSSVVACLEAADSPFHLEQELSVEGKAKSLLFFRR